MVFARPYQVPIDEVARAVEDGLHMTAAEVPALYYGVDGLQDVGGVELERPRDKEAGQRSVDCKWRLEPVVVVNDKKVGIRVQGVVKFHLTLIPPGFFSSSDLIPAFPPPPISSRPHFS